MAIDLTQTSYSTIASVDLEVGDKRSDHWQQKEYKSSMPELKEINLKFINVINYNWNSEKSEKNIEYESILEFTYYKNIVHIVLEEVEIG